MFKDKKVIIFDLDGTLLDSIGIWNESDKTLIKKFGYQKDLDIMEIGKNRERTLARLSKSSNPYFDYCQVLKEKYHLKAPVTEIYKARYEIANDYLINKLDYKPYANLLLQKLKERNYLLVIASTTMQKNIDIYKTKNQNIIKKANFNDYFNLILTKEDVLNAKPNPEVFLQVLDKLQVQKEDCLIFEDSLVGVMAAKESGIDCCSVYDKYADVDRDKITKLAKYNVKSFLEVIKILENEEL